MKKLILSLILAGLALSAEAQQTCFGTGCNTVPVDTRGGTLLDPTGAIDVVVWRAPYACTVNKVQALQVGGTSGEVQARKNGATAFLASNLATTAGTWASTSTIQNATVAVDDYLEIRIISLVGTPTGMTIQIQCQK